MGYNGARTVYRSNRASLMSSFFLVHIYGKKGPKKEPFLFLYLFKYGFTAPERILPICVFLIVICIYRQNLYTAVKVYLFIYRERQLSLGVAQQENRFIMLYCGMTPERPIWFHDLKRKWAGTELSI